MKTKTINTHYGQRVEHANAYEEIIDAMPQGVEHFGENIRNLFLLNKERFVALLGVLAEDESRLLPIDYDALSDAWNEQRRAVYFDLEERGYKWVHGSVFSFMNHDKTAIDACAIRLKIVALMEASIYLNLSNTMDTYELIKQGNRIRES